MSWKCGGIRNQTMSWEATARRPLSEEFKHAEVHSRAPMATFILLGIGFDNYACETGTNAVCMKEPIKHFVKSFQVKHTCLDRQPSHSYCKFISTNLCYCKCLRRDYFHPHHFKLICSTTGASVHRPHQISTVLAYVAVFATLHLKNGSLVS